MKLDQVMRVRGYDEAPRHSPLAPGPRLEVVMVKRED